MKDIDDNIKKLNIARNNITLRNHIAENDWASRQINQFNINHTTDAHGKLHIKLTNNNMTKKSNHTLFADDTSIDIATVNDIELILDTYNVSITIYRLIIQWGTAELLTKNKLVQKIPKSPKYITSSLQPNTMRIQKQNPRTHDDRW